jgi:hypothetical protein
VAAACHWLRAVRWLLTARFEQRQAGLEPGVPHLEGGLQRRLGGAASRVSRVVVASTTSWVAVGYLDSLGRADTPDLR